MGFVWPLVLVPTSVCPNDITMKSSTTRHQRSYAKCNGNHRVLRYKVGPTREEGACNAERKKKSMDGGAEKKNHERAL